MTARDRERRRRRVVLWERGGWWCLATGFVASFTLSALETGITPISKEHFREFGGLEEEKKRRGPVVCVRMNTPSPCSHARTTPAIPFLVRPDWDTMQNSYLFSGLALAALAAVLLTVALGRRGRSDR